MKFNRTVFLLLVPTVLSLHCNRQTVEKTTVFGCMFEKGNNHVISGEKVYVSHTVCPDRLPCMGVIDDSAITDANGNYQITFAAIDGPDYYVGCNPPFPYWPDVGTAFKAGNKKRINVLVDPPAYVRLLLTNTGVNQEFGFLVRNRMNTLNYYTQSDTTITCRTIGLENTYLYWQYHDPANNVVEHRDTVFIPAYDTLDYQITY